MFCTAVTYGKEGKEMGVFPASFSKSCRASVKAAIWWNAELGAALPAVMDSSCPTDSDHCSIQRPENNAEVLPRVWKQALETVGSFCPEVLLISRYLSSVCRGCHGSAAFQLGLTWGFFTTFRDSSKVWLAQANIFGYL